MEKEKKLRIYDQYVEITLTNLFSLSKGSDTINLVDFEVENEEHLFLLSCAFLARDVFNKQICIDMSFTKLCRLNWTIRKAHPMIKKLRKKNREKVISCNELLNYERSSYQQYFGDNVDFSDIYKEFFERNFKHGTL